jgi:hypothetical protein
LLASLAVTNFSARPPGACVATLQCGHVEVTLVPDAAPALAVERTGVLSPLLLELEDPAGFVGSGTLTARLLVDDGSEYLSASGDPVTASLPVVFSAPQGCVDAP